MLRSIPMNNPDMIEGMIDLAIMGRTHCVDELDNDHQLQDEDIEFYQGVIDTSNSVEMWMKYWGFKFLKEVELDLEDD